MCECTFGCVQLCHECFELFVNVDDGVVVVAVTVNLTGSKDGCIRPQGFYRTCTYWGLTRYSHKKTTEKNKQQKP